MSLTFADPPDFSFASRRSPVVGRRGMVATSQPLAVVAGLEILAAGGSAADAAVATAAALNVTEPTSTGIGGDAFALHYDADGGSVTALNGSGRAPGALTLERLAREGFGDQLPAFHAHTVTVPGACAAWCDLIARHGRLPLARVLAPAIRLAEEGFPVAPLTAFHWARGAARQLAAAPNGGELLMDGRAPRPGEVFRNPGLARTLRAVAEGGAAAFYEGPIAVALSGVVQQAGGCLTEADLAGHRSDWVTPITTTYRGFRVWECPPNGQGLAALLALNILEGFDPADMPRGSALRLHRQIEALRLAFADTRWYAADPDTDPAPLAQLLSKGYADARRALMRDDRAALDPRRGAPVAGSDTVYLSVVDGEGNACSFINSNYVGFGTGMVPKGWGFTLQNRGLGFSLDPQHPNHLAPGKRPYHTIIPGLITRVAAAAPAGGGVDAAAGSPPSGEALFACFGVMGGFMQPQGHVQVAMGLIDDALDPQAALDAPRFCIAEELSGGPVAVEAGLPEAELAALAARGHALTVTSGHARAVFGRGQVILRDADSGVLWGGSDPRADGCAMGW
ncbi:MAG: gamma-glutamyltransferase family protein [Anaerolineae bacterium]